MKYSSATGAALINSNLIPLSLVITKGLEDLRALQTENYPIICLLLTLERAEVTEQLIYNKTPGRYYLVKSLTMLSSHLELDSSGVEKGTAEVGRGGGGEEC